MASTAAVEAIEAAGGTVTCVHFNKLAIRALMKPYKFDIFPLRARPNPKIMGYYLDVKKCGFLSPEIQRRNIALFGTITSEERMRREHEAFMLTKREEYQAVLASAEDARVEGLAEMG